MEKGVMAFSLGVSRGFKRGSNEVDSALKSGVSNFEDRVAFEPVALVDSIDVFFC